MNNNDNKGIKIVNSSQVLNTMKNKNEFLDAIKIFQDEIEFNNYDNKVRFIELCDISPDDGMNSPGKFYHAEKVIRLYIEKFKKQDELSIGILKEILIHELFHAEFQAKIEKNYEFNKIYNIKSFGSLSIVFMNEYKAYLKSYSSYKKVQAKSKETYMKAICSNEAIEEMNKYLENIENIEKEANEISRKILLTHWDDNKNQIKDFQKEHFDITSINNIDELNLIINMLARRVALKEILTKCKSDLEKKIVNIIRKIDIDSECNIGYLKKLDKYVEEYIRSFHIQECNIYVDGFKAFYCE